MSKPNLVITGHYGFIGINFLQELLNHSEEQGNLLERYENLILIDRDSLNRKNTKEFQEILNELSDHIPVVEFNDDINEMKTSINPEDYKTKFDILNFASESHVDDSIKDPFYIYNSNTKITPSLVEIFGFKNIGNFWHIRTDEEYGHLENASDEPFDDNSYIQPRNPYSSSKASQTLFLESLRKTFNFPVGYFVLANQYGPYQHESKMIPATVKRIVNKEPALIYGKGEQYREWTSVLDTVKKIYYTLQYNSKFYYIKRNLFISDKKGFTNNLNLVRIIVKQLEYRTGYEGMYRFVEDRKGHDFCYKIKSDFDFNGELSTVELPSKYSEGYDFSIPETVRLSLLDTVDFYLEEYSK